MSVPFLLEIGVEEVPDWMILSALDHMRELFTAVLTEHRLGGSVSRVDATPRRLVLRAEGLLEAQPDQTVTVSGPPASANEKAVEGFAKKQGVTLADLKKVQTDKGEYWQFEKHVPGRRTADILSEALPGLIGKIYFPKTMYWTGKGGARFIRPVRWILALLNDAVVPFEFAGVASGNTTDGHRIIGKAGLPVTIGTYEKTLLENGVILDASRRRERIASAVQSAGAINDEDLIQTLVYLTEYPTAITGTFDAAFLELPGEILSTVMRHHQRNFSVPSDEPGKLKNQFVAVMNIASDPDGLVQRGNERVLKARFNDGRFFWNVDLKRPLGDRLADLKNVTFQAKLGNYYEKTQRNIALAKEIAASLKADVNAAGRAAELAKCDLPTEMVKEFTELQGVVGGLYAREQGEPEPVWRGVYEHYKPVSMEDSIPASATGQIVSLADKVDTLRGCFAIGLIPSGSKDPFALRRAAQGVVKIIVEGNLRLSLATLAGGNEQLAEFLRDRIRYYFREVRGYKYDEVNAAMAAGSDDLVDLAERLEALRVVRATPNFEPLAASFKRMANILKQADFRPEGPIDNTLIEEGPEMQLVAEVAARRIVLPNLTYSEALKQIAGLRPALDRFFDKVLVNAPDERVRRNRLTLLSSLLSEFSTIADFSEIVVTTQQ